ncbi:MAG: hypothetical protein HYT42_00635 [Candidatus Sungbacteria bacterium]|nr:hypothetical protein [Candidatus Sungbacteria bacterium]
MSKAEDVVLPILADCVREEHPHLNADDIAKLIQHGKLQLTCNGKEAFIAVQTRRELPADGFYASWRQREERVHILILFPQGASVECREKAMRIANQTYASLGIARPVPSISIRVAVDEVDEDGRRNFILKLP